MRRKTNPAPKYHRPFTSYPGQLDRILTFLNNPGTGPVNIFRQSGVVG